MRKQPLDPVIADEIRHDRDMEHAQELLAAQIDETMDKVWAEVANGDHDLEIFSTSYVDSRLLGKIARCAVDNGTLHPNDHKDLYLQITDYVRDVAEMRLIR